MSQLALQLIEKEKKEKTGYLDLGLCRLKDRGLFDIFCGTPSLQTVWDALSIMDVELPIMLKRYQKGDLQVIPIILRPCGWELTILSEFNALPEKGKPITLYDSKDTAFLDVLNGINKVVDNPVI